MCKKIILKNRFLYKISKPKQYLISFSLIIFVSVICFLLSYLIGYKIVALILLLTVSLVAMFFDIMPVLFSAILSALIWDYFFIPPIFTFSIGEIEDKMMYLTFIFIGIMSGYLAKKTKNKERKSKIITQNSIFEIILTSKKIMALTIKK